MHPMPLYAEIENRLNQGGPFMEYRQRIMHERLRANLPGPAAILTTATKGPFYVGRLAPDPILWRGKGLEDSAWLGQCPAARWWLSSFTPTRAASLFLIDSSSGRPKLGAEYMAGKLWYLELADFRLIVTQFRVTHAESAETEISGMKGAQTFAPLVRVIDFSITDDQHEDLADGRVWADRLSSYRPWKVLCPGASFRRDPRSLAEHKRTGFWPRAE